MALGVAVLIALLWIPECARAVPERPEGHAFEWRQDEVWSALGLRFEAARTKGCDPADLTGRLQSASARADELLATRPPPTDERWTRAETSFFELAADLGGCPERFAELLELRNRIWRAAKGASISWPEDRVSRDRLYRVLYGTRAAAEELLLQLPPSEAPGVNIVQDVPSQTPSIEVEGVVIHSGDLLVSRGGAPTSAFIARGNDYPGNFSHVALVHVDDDGTASVIEAHIERGVAIATPKAYFADKKLRILVLRLREDHPARLADPQLPHAAAADALAEAKSRHIPYDFAMDFADPTAQFCSEVASANYARHDVELWRSLSSFSSPGLARWMAAFGVEQLETHGPSDLEYDPQLAVVAEWHDRDTLFDDHVDNAIIDAMLTAAEAGAEVKHSVAMLPVARLAKAYSAVLNLFGKEGPVPEGMSATVALRATWLADHHAALEVEVMKRASAFEKAQGRPAAYWELVEFANEVVKASP